MGNDYISDAEAMRAKAWEELQALPAFRAFVLADKMVVGLGGDSLISSLGLGESRPSLVRTTTADRNDFTPQRRPRSRALDVGTSSRSKTHTEVAVEVLEKLGPMGMIALLDRAREYGARIGGNDPLNNFRSSLSKDGKFYHFRHNGEHYWWLTDVPLPEGWNGAADDLLGQAAALDQRSEKGGDDHETAIDSI